MNIVDIHSHIIFGADDGSDSLAESLVMLRLAWEEGVRAVFATPHYGLESCFTPEAGLVQHRFDQLREAARRELPGLSLYLGTEWYCADDLPDRIRAGEAFPMNGTKYVLLEFMEWGGVSEGREDMLRRLRRVAESGYIPILAHAERYKRLREDFSVFAQIKALGALIQVNAYDLFLNHSVDIRNAAQYLAHERLIDFLGSDMHGMPPRRAPLMRAGVQWLYENTDQAYADAVAFGNATRLLIQP